MARAVLVDASAAYIASAKAEAIRRNRSDMIRFVHADFLDVAGQLPPADIVTLDRVVCCYPDYERLMSAAISLSSKWLALLYPKGHWYVKAALAFENLMRRLKRNPFRTFVHSPVALETLLARSGFQLIEQRGTFVWRVQVWREIRIASRNRQEKTTLSADAILFSDRHDQRQGLSQLPRQHRICRHILIDEPRRETGEAGIVLACGRS